MVRIDLAPGRGGGHVAPYPEIVLKCLEFVEMISDRNALHYALWGQTPRAPTFPRSFISPGSLTDVM